MHQRLTHTISLLLILAGSLLVLTQFGTISADLAQAAPLADTAVPETAADKVDSQVLEALTADGEADFFIWLTEKADLSQAARLNTRAEKGQWVFEALYSTAERTQKPLRAYLDQQGVAYQTFYIANKILVRGGNAVMVNNLAKRADVARIAANHTYQLDKPLLSPDAPIGIEAIEPNITFINADDVWNDGYTGTGIVVAGIDTGLDWTHPAIQPRYRGWDGGTADHNYNWWDATATYPTTPTDVHGHGTHTTGTMVGDDGAGNQIGVAPGAQTIHCKSLNDSGVGTLADATECFEWALAPWDLTGSNPDPTKAPDAINNSWTTATGNVLDFTDEIAALQAAGILVEASAGNGGPTCGTVGSPGDYQNVLTTGSVNSAGAFPGTLSTTSSRGPSSPYPGATVPDVMAPGENIRSALPGGTYGALSGTSMAGPHVTGLVALMWEANPDLRGLVAQTAQLIADTAVPLTGQAGSSCGGDYTNGPNHDWGHGTIDANAAVQAALAYGSAGDIIRVTPTGETSGICGGDWSTPCDLLYALNSVANLGDELWVAAGVYKPTTSTTDQTAYIELKPEVDVYGGFAGTETLRSQRDPAANVTIFSGDIDGNDSQSPIVTDAATVTGTTTNSYHVVAGTPTGATLDGVTITGGYGYYGCPYGWNSQFGGGLYTEGDMTINNVTFSGNQNFRGGGLYTTAVVTITNSTFTGNYSSGEGGGIRNEGGAITLINVTFSNNRAYTSGGGMFGSNFILNNVEFSDNWAGSNAGGLYVQGSATLADVAFTHNGGGNIGGGMSIWGSAPVTLTRVTFADNYGPTTGGGLGGADNVNVTLNAVTFSGNSAGSGGAIGALSGGNWALNNVLLTGNTATSDGGGISSSSAITLTNVTLVNNTATHVASSGGGIKNFGGNFVVRNSIIWGNRAGWFDHNISGGATVSYSDVEGGWPGTNNLDADPLLAPLGNYGGAIQSRALLPGSGVFDAGDPATCLAADMRGVERPTGMPCDMGAFESQGFTFGSLTGTPQSVTLNGTFVTPPGMIVTANHLNEPVDGGKVTFTAPGSGPSATFTGNPATIGAEGAVSVIAAANEIPGSYTVSATAAGVSTPAQFALSNVTGVDTTTTITSAPNPADYGTSVIFTATVTSPMGTPGGFVQFYADGTPLGPLVSLANGTATISTASLYPGDHSITAAYRGDAEHNVSTSDPITQTIGCADTLAVTNAYNSGVGSLRYMLVAVCAGGVITFDNDYTITLASELTIDKSITIDGDGHRVVLSGNNATRVLRITAGPVTLDHLTIINGRPSSNNCGPYGSRACGGGIWIQGSNVVLQNSTLSGNFASDMGGGIFNYQSTLTVRNSTFSDNTAQYEQGGAIRNNYGNLNVSHSTFSGNSASPGGAIYSNGTWQNQLNVTQSIFWGNSGGEIGNSVSTASVTYNIVQGGWAGTGNLDVDPLLLPLADYGGHTWTRALSPNSPAIDAGNPASCLTTDQRGLPRNDLRCDMGAYEMQYDDGDTVIRPVAADALTTFGPALAGVQRNGALADPGVITVTKRLEWASQGPESIGAWWEITPTVAEGFSLTLQLCYTAEELGTLNENNLRFWRLRDGSWAQVGDAPTLTTVNGRRCAMISGVDGLSVWTLATAEPTAVSLSSFSAASRVGWVGWWVGLLAMGGMATAVLWRRRK